MIETAPASVKARGLGPRLVAVVASPTELQRALRLRRPPDLFELRLDALSSSLAELEETIADLSAPFIITARHPREGGQHGLSARARRELLLRFLPRATWVDVELRSISALRPVLERARELRVQRILSVHRFARCPTATQLTHAAELARAAGADLLKIATRLETARELQRLLDFTSEVRRLLPVSAMGIGKFGRASRVLLAQNGSALNYAHLGTAAVAGQLSLAELRRVLQR